MWSEIIRVGVGIILGIGGVASVCVCLLELRDIHLRSKGEK